MSSTITLVVIGIIVIGVIAWLIKTYNNLITFSERVSNSKGQIATQIESRWDAVQNLIQATKQYAKHESETLENVVAKRINVSANTPINQVEESNQQLDQVVGRLIAISESYPDLKASEVYKSTMDSVNKYEDQVRHSRMIYNDSVTRYNQIIRMFPSNFAAKIFGFSVAEYFESTEEKQSMPSWE